MNSMGFLVQAMEFLLEILMISSVTLFSSHLLSSFSEILLKDTL